VEVPIIVGIVIVCVYLYVYGIWRRIVEGRISPWLLRKCDGSWIWSLWLANIAGSADESPTLPNWTSHCTTGALDTSRTSRCPTALRNGRDKVSGL